jgi:hypothetical protein
LILNAQKLDYGDDKNVRLLVAVSDVTDARAAARVKDDLIREKAVLLQELQHRVANSLQIVASVLMQSARRVNSDEARGYLYDAHSRVMSVATVQQQLAASRLGDVALRPYFTDLCHSIGASMIRDHDQLSLKVKADSFLNLGPANGKRPRWPRCSPRRPLETRASTPTKWTSIARALSHAGWFLTLKSSTMAMTRTFAFWWRCPM